MSDNSRLVVAFSLIDMALTLHPGALSAYVARKQARAQFPPGSVIDHIDGNPFNNDPANLRVVTPSEDRR